jgi:branched-chain amino acid transport system substrate-binding protein
MNGARRLLVLLLLASACSPSSDPVVIGAIYPTGGGQGSGGIEEYRGVELAAELANLRGGLGGRPIELDLIPADSAEGGPPAVEALVARDVPAIVGTYGSTISAPVAEAATRRGVVFWETGAVGELDGDVASGRYVFRFAPMGSVLGADAVSFVSEVLLPRLPDPPRSPRYSVVYVDDAYGRSVGLGAARRIRDAGLPLAATFPYDLARVDYDRLARRIGRARTDVLVVAAYLEDAVAMRRALLRAEVPLVAGIGTSSSYCHPAFGDALGPDAVGLFASDKLDADYLDPAALEDEAGSALSWARREYRHRFDQPMSSAALSGFAGGWALFHHVLPRARSFAPEDVAAAARATRLPTGALPNGGGLAFASPGHPDAGANLRAATVIWEWVEPFTRAVVWPPSRADSPVIPLIPR